jgi:DNA-binding transcriptional ArsR family regulator
MSPARPDVRGQRARVHAAVFAALGDRTRLALLARISRAPSLSITRLAAGSKVTRQSIAKHLRVLEDAGVVRAVRHGRERRYELNAARLGEAAGALADISRQWDDALGRLKSFVEG